MTPADDKEKIDLIADHIEEIIRLLGEDCSREGLLKTPVRSAKALYYLTSGYRADIDAVVHQALFDHDGSRIVMVKDIEFYSMCEHHILPFFGKISIAYIPDGRIIGLSKVARLVNVFARRLQVQERLTAQVCREVGRIVGAKGVMVVCNAHHLCMKMRGVEKQESTTTTMDYVGAFADDASLRQEFLDLLKV
mgnify:FL=1|jgi:GTP cyclohydrolase I